MPNTFRPLMKVFYQVKPSRDWFNLRISGLRDIAYNKQKIIARKAMQKAVEPIRTLASDLLRAQRNSIKFTPYQIKEGRTSHLYENIVAKVKIYDKSNALVIVGVIGPRSKTKNTKHASIVEHGTRTRFAGVVSVNTSRGRRIKNPHYKKTGNRVRFTGVMPRFTYMRNAIAQAGGTAKEIVVSEIQAGIVRELAKLNK